MARRKRLKGEEFYKRKTIRLDCAFQGEVYMNALWSLYRLGHFDTYAIQVVDVLNNGRTVREYEHQFPATHNA